MRRPFTLLLPLFALLLMAVACDEGGRPEGTASPTTTETPPITSTGTPAVDTTPSPSQAEAQPAVVPADESEFLAQFQDVVIMQENCSYDQDSGLVDCGAKGLYQLQDGIQGTDAVCRVMLVDDQPVGLNCQTQEPLQAIIYAIQPSPMPTPAP